MFYQWGGRQGGLRARCPNQLILLTQSHSASTPSSLLMSELLTSSPRPSTAPLRGKLIPRLHSFCLNPEANRLRVGSLFQPHDPLVDLPIHPAPTVAGRLSGTACDVLMRVRTHLLLQSYRDRMAHCNGSSAPHKESQSNVFSKSTKHR